MTTTNELMERIQKYECVDRFCILNKSGTRLNTELRDDDKKGGTQNTNFPDIPKLVDKALSVVRDIDPINELSFIQITYGNYEYLISQDEELYVFTSIIKPNQKQN